MPMTAFPDETLADLTRAGDERAYAELWRRHSEAGRAAACRFAQIADPDDLVQEAFLLVYSAMAQGNGPTGAFRPYLYRTIRNVAVSLSRKHDARAAGDERDLALLPGAPVVDSHVDETLEKTITARAFGRLPERWQTVLWYTAVEGMPPRDVAPILALTPNATAALALRAREGLRVEWLRAHLEHPGVEPECRRTVERFPELERGALGAVERDEVRAHLEGCLRCRIIHDELDEVASMLRMVLLPLVLAAPGLGTGGVLSGVPSPREPGAGEVSSASTGTGSTGTASTGTPSTGTAPTGTAPTGAASTGAGTGAATGSAALGVPAALGLTAAAVAVLALSLAPVVVPETDRRAASMADATAPERDGGSPPPRDRASAGAAGAAGAAGTDAERRGDAPHSGERAAPDGVPEESPSASADADAVDADDPLDASSVPVPAPGEDETVDDAASVPDDEPEQERGTGALDTPSWSWFPSGPQWSTPTLTGFGQPGARVEIRDVRSVVLLAAAEVDAAGRWMAGVNGAAAGEVLLEARQVHGGVVSPPLIAPRALDLRAPALVDPAPGSTVSIPGGRDGSLAELVLVLVLSGEAGMSVQVSFDGAPTGRVHVLGEGPLARVRTGVTPGGHTVGLRYVDLATGRTGATATYSFTVELELGTEPPPAA